MTQGTGSDVKPTADEGSEIFPEVRQIALLAERKQALMRSLAEQPLPPAHRQRSGLDRALCFLTKKLFERVRRAIDGSRARIE